VLTAALGFAGGVAIYATARWALIAFGSDRPRSQQRTLALIASTALACACAVALANILAALIAIAASIGAMTALRRRARAGIIVVDPPLLGSALTPEMTRKLADLEREALRSNGPDHVS
jgi:hypothetical protein